VTSALFIATAILAIFAEEQRRLPSLPDREGFAGSFAGVSHGALLVAGGANFPDKKPWDGGKKVWTDAVFVLEKPTGEWKIAGWLPRPLGYGVSATHRDGVICVGGSNADGHFADSFRLEWRDGKLTTTSLPSLPEPLANGCGTLVGDILYIAGGQYRPDSTTASRKVWALDLSIAEIKWKECAPLPGGGRILPVAAACDGAFWVVGGAEIVDGKRSYLKDAYRFTPAAGWQRVADLPRPIVAAPSPAPSDSSGFFILGGDDGSQVNTPPQTHRGFSTDVFYYDVKSNYWTKARCLESPRVTTPCVRWNDSWVIPSGEIRPGIRSPEVWSWKPSKVE
jgi:N-acetylneuraminate epimerase